MKKEEMQRIRRYSKRLNRASGDVIALRPEERKDLCMLLQKWKQEQMQIYETSLGEGRSDVFGMG